MAKQPQQGGPWPPKPKSLSERGYRKYMAKTATATVNGMEFKFQSVSPTFYFGLSDRCRMAASGQRDGLNYMDELFKNVVVSPREVAAKGMAYFDEQDDIATPAALIGEIESFLASRGKYAVGQKASAE